MADTSAALAEVVARIAAPDAPGTTSDETPASGPAALTGELAVLARWWHAVAADRPLAPVDVPCAAGTIAEGVAAADRAVDAGATLLVPRVAERNDLAARTVIALLTRREASSVVHQPVGLPDREWMARVAAVRDAVAASTELRGDPEQLTAALGASGIAVAVGVLLGAAARRTPVIVDGTDELAAALLADRICYRAKGWWRPGSTSPDPGRIAAVDRLDVASGVPLDLGDDAGLGARATLALLGLALDVPDGS